MSVSRFYSARFLVIMAMVIPGFSCTTMSGKSFLPMMTDYHESKKEVYVLKKKLLEISGIAYLSDHQMAGVNDEEGKLFIFDPARKNTIEAFKFGGKGDYEDMVKTDSLFYVLESNGNIHEVTPPPHVSSQVFSFPDKDRIEFESMVWYKELGKLIIITKDRRHRLEGISAYSFDLALKQFDAEPFFNIPAKTIFLKLQDYSAECKPSAAAIHPLTHQLFIVASIGKLLLVCSKQGVIESIHRLNPAQFPQPEGITFAPNGDMYIANEGLEGKATILKFPYTIK